MNDVILDLNGVCKTYTRKRDGKRQEIKATNGVSFQVRKQHVVALVGESGSGKSTLAKLITGIERPDRGDIVFDGKSTNAWLRGGSRTYRKYVQMVFQDPFAALNPLSVVQYAVERPLVNYRNLSGRELKQAVLRVLETVHLTPVDEFVKKYPFELSGGQLQRVVFARAIASKPKLIVADEPVSMLDVSIRAEILKLMADLRDKEGVAFLYITHDLISARMLADEIVVLYRGTVVEKGNANDVVRKPMHPYTQLLLKSIPNPWAPEDVHLSASERPKSGSASTGGCVFQTRCPHAMKKCSEGAPTLSDMGDERWVACFLHDGASSVDAGQDELDYTE
ncbi:ABC transporter ATP-binding protein [Alicyclobacillus acidiphilus]|uniref:ABC transporter ATP-binding protein n=1 Tax=Alicyclobacillus acidiphilus TaxID=182455 RepID=UPI00082F0E4A|nr:ABC transporter ATP-binding protein [Alicyclobacillus acidiphilus]